MVMGKSLTIVNILGVNLQQHSVASEDAELLPLRTPSKESLNVSTHTFRTNPSDFQS